MRVEGGRPRSFEEGSQFEEVPKRQRREDVDQDEDQVMDEDHDDGFEEEPKREAVEDHHEFYEGDTDDECEHELTIPRTAIDYACGSKSDVPETTPYPDETKEAQSCLHLDVCSKYRHACKFKGRRLFELFKVQIIRLKNEGSSIDGSSSSLEGPLCGVIEFDTRDSPDAVSYYADSISLKLEHGKIVNLPLSGPKPGYTPRTNFYELVKLAFNFKFKGYVLDDLKLLEPRLMSWYRDMDYSPAISRRMFGDPRDDPFIMFASVASYDGALATVSVKILKKNVRSCSGFVFARPCIFVSRIRLLSLQKDETRELELEGSGCPCVKLTRSIVAVPSYSSLIIAAVLYDQDGKEIGRGRTSFRAKPEGTDSNVIGNDNIHIGVNWECYWQ